MSQLSVVKSIPSRYVFNNNELKRWKININSLPKNSIIAKTENLIFKQYKNQIIIILICVLIEILIIFLLIINYTRKKRIEKSLVEKEERLSLAQKGADLGLWDWDILNDKITFNEKLYDIFYPRLHEIEPDFNGFKTLIYKDDLALFMNIIKLHLENKTPFYEVVHRILNKNEKIFWVLNRGKIVEYDKNNKPVRLVGTILDITKLKNSEEELANSEKRFRLFIESSPIGVFLIRERKFIYANSTYLKISKYNSEKELIGNDILSHCPEFFQDKMGKFITDEEYNNDYAHDFETEWLRKDKSTFPIKMNLSKINLRQRGSYFSFYKGHNGTKNRRKKET